MLVINIFINYAVANKSDTVQWLIFVTVLTFPFAQLNFKSILEVSWTLTRVFEL